MAEYDDDDDDQWSIYREAVAEWIASRRGKPGVPSSSPAKKAADFSVITKWLKITYMLF